MPACCPVASRLSHLLVVVLALGLTSFAATGEEPSKAAAADAKALPGPKPEYAPEQVVQIVMDALQNNDAADSGIVTAFNFASPANKEVTGPVARFIPMVKTPAYKPMLNFKTADHAKAAVDGDAAEQAVTLIAADGEAATYVFRLSKQTDGEFKGCWMTDGVFRVEPKGKAV